MGKPWKGGGVVFLYIWQRSETRWQGGEGSDSEAAKSRNHLPNVETESGQKPLPLSKDTKLCAFRILYSNACPAVARVYGILRSMT